MSNFCASRFSLIFPASSRLTVKSRGGQLFVIVKGSMFRFMSVNKVWFYFLKCIISLIQTRHFGTQYFSMTNKVSSNKRTLNCFVCLFTLIYLFVKSLPWPLDIHGSKIYFYIFISQYLFIAISFYRNIFLSQYCASNCLVWIRP
jgi:hypothetical protein